MKRLTTSELIQKMNNILKNNKQKLRIIVYTDKCAELSNGKILNRKEVKKLYKRLTRGILLYPQNFDILYSFNNDEILKKEKEIKQIFGRKGGYNCQKKYPNIVSHILNSPSYWKGKKLPYNVWNKGKTKYTDDRLKKISIDRTGDGNPMFGKHLSIECRENKSKIMKEKILKGEFTPNVHNSQTHWQCIVGNKKFRSSWEAIYHILHDDLKYETIRIPYFDENNIKRIYIVDFINEKEKKLIEIKPSSHRDSIRFIKKIEAATEWCSENNFTFHIISDDYFYNKKNDIENIKGYDDIKEKMLSSIIKYESKMYRKNK